MSMSPDNSPIDPDTMDSIDIEYDKLKAVPPKVEVLEGKLSILTYFQKVAYNPETYKPEDKFRTKNANDEVEIKSIPLSTFIRWKLNSEKKPVSAPAWGLHHHHQLFTEALRLDGLMGKGEQVERAERGH